MTLSSQPQPVVVDASAAVEFIGGNRRWTEAFDEWASDDRLILAPVHFLAEVANAQLRGRRTVAAEVATTLERLLAAGVEVVDRGLAGMLEAIQLAERHSLTVYDALYLQLALDVDAELATLDRDLGTAAESEGVALMVSGVT